MTAGKMETVTERPVAAKGSLTTYSDALRRMSKAAVDAGDAVAGGKLEELAGKLSLDIATLAFCGHFSAGKSTLVNALCGAQLLPSSPIPTSANVVTIANGEPAVKVEFVGKDGSVKEIPGVSVERLGDLAVDGEGVSSIEVRYPIPLLGDSLALVDTPGVDSTDGAHRAATESALHLADVVFYVTDYNHVLSDVNFRFLRMLHQWGKPTYLIVNQIDKHRESEVRFEAFRDGLASALEAWRIDLAGLLFLSMRKPDHPLSQMSELLNVIEALKGEKEKLLLHSADRSARHLAGEFKEGLLQRQAERRETLLAQAGGESGLAELAERRAALAAELESARTAGERQLDGLKRELDQLLGNTGLTPAETREKARAVLESRQTGFKVGWLGSGAKTEAERERRLAELAQDFAAQAEANLHVHVRAMLRREARNAGSGDAAWESSLEAAFPAPDADWIASLVKPGAGAGGDATLQYASELSADWKRKVRKTALERFEEIVASRQPEREAAAAALASSLGELSDRQAAADRLRALDAEANEAERKLVEMLPMAGVTDIAGLKLPAPRPLAAKTTSQPVPADAAPVVNLSIAGGEAAAEEAAEAGENASYGAFAGAAEVLERGAAMLSPFPELARQREALSAKAAQLRDSRFTIALFGAFSAGKSSFANALVGQPALPVSPNPTTATINRIVAPAEDAPHGTARIYMKEADDMRSDLAHSLARLGVRERDIEAAAGPAELFALAARMSPDDIHPRGRPHLAFLRAAARGWERYGPLLGTSFTAEGADYRRYVADEEASCFVASADLHVDSPLTRSGAVLVDTPGADSINARHTGVAFEYIKNADAVLFVTYYNHAFTEADRSFLHQLGSVKDAFELDKMFFVLNAADLASSAEELAGVAAHVESQLLKHGIRQPRIYPVSSLLGLEAKLAGDAAGRRSSGLADFEAAFRRFADEELGSLALASARKQLDRIGARIDGLLGSASEDAASRQASAAAMLGAAESLREAWSAGPPEAAIQPLVEELGEQLYHMRRRVQYRFGEHFMTAFHPSVLQDDGRDLRKLIVSCWLDLKRGVGEDLQQELRSAGLRMETALGRLLGRQVEDGIARAGLGGFETEPPAAPALGLPVSEPFGSGPDWDGRKLWQAFRSPKHFFEREGSGALKNEAEAALFQAADAWLAGIREAWADRLAAAFEGELRAVAVRLSSELAAYADGVRRALETPGLEDALRRLQSEWQQLKSGV
ncbi:Dynamin family protein [Cohnella sp. OV330]|uniref:dynamin family protein n=1 Tax=Cohnella sp. OV330 TaxID=1855288 RepID=UPI0008E62D57|nr:dynamin family protein [Cohnella sp. OV330]SFB17312.1 Dynamin family protein [Cohnella sp. OV330]